MCALPWDCKCPRLCKQSEPRAIYGISCTVLWSVRDTRYPISGGKTRFKASHKIMSSELISRCEWDQGGLETAFLASVVSFRYQRTVYILPNEDKAVELGPLCRYQLGTKLLRLLFPQAPGRAWRKWGTCER